MLVHFEVPADLQPEVGARLSYAFRLFCAIYGHIPSVGTEPAQPCDLTIRYLKASARNSTTDAHTVWLCRGYLGRDPRQPAPAPLKFQRQSLSTILHYAPQGGESPDWLGEIFEWVSCADEYSVSARDRIGRPLYQATYAGRHSLDMRVPYAALAMRGLQQEICRVLPCASENAQAPEGVSGHVVIPTHDVDYFPLSRVHTVNRLARNAVISCLIGHGPMLGLRQAGRAVRLALGAKDDPLDQINALATEEQNQGFSASYYFLVRNGHRHDARYSLEDPGVVESMHWLLTRGMEIGLHGSFTSLDSPCGLEYEADAMRRRGISPQGSRQHWLHYTLERLIPAIESAGLQYDASIGWSTRVGFRAGACFAFPPYDFARERPANFLELPLIVMDQALRVPDDGEEQLFQEVAQVLSASRELGWGGVTLLWHPAAFGSGWLAPEIGKVFWRLAADRMRQNDQWMPSSQFLELARERFVQAGLLSKTAQMRAIEMPLEQPSHQAPAEVYGLTA
jgi:hypothetical protein